MNGRHRERGRDGRFKKTGDPDVPKEIKSPYKHMKLGNKVMRNHRAVWTMTYGPIPKGYIVHHRNGNKGDNRLENLELMTFSEHSRLHLNSNDSVLRKRTREARSIAAKKGWEKHPAVHGICEECGKEWTGSFNFRRFCSEACEARSLRKRKKQVEGSDPEPPILVRE